MEKFYKLKPGTETAVATRNYKLIIGLLVVLPIAFLIGNIKTGESVAVSVVTAVFTALLLGGIFYLVASVMIIAHRQTVYITDADGIRRIMNINEADLNVIQKLVWTKAKEQQHNRNAYVRWSDLTSAEDKKHSIFLKSKNFNSLTGEGSMMLPKEIEGFDEIDTLIRNKMMGL
jgi:hypothetical protein